MNLIFDAVIRKIGPVRSESVCFNTVHASLEVGIVNINHDVWSGSVKHFIAALVTFKVFKGWLAVLEHGSHSAVGNHYALR